MEYVPLGRGGPRVSVVGLGMWQAGGNAWGADVRDADCQKAMERAVELGINLVDTAEAYGDGHSEEVMSRAIKNVAAIGSSSRRKSAGGTSTRTT